MTTLLSPGVVTSEVDVSHVAQAISNSIAGIVGAAKKGAVNKRIYLSSQDNVITKLGTPLLSDYGVQTASLFMKQASNGWYNRVASLRGSDPVATANTDVRAVLTQDSSTSFVAPSDIVALAGGSTQNLRLRFDGDTDKDITVTFTTAVVTSLVRSTMRDTMVALTSWLDGVLSLSGTAEPRYGYTGYTQLGDGSYVLTITSELKSGLSKIEVLVPTGTDAAANFGWTSGVTSVDGYRTIMLDTNLVAAVATSLPQGAGGFNLGTPATTTSANAATYNLGTLAVGNLVSNAMGGSPTAYSFVAVKESVALATISADASGILAQLQAAPYAFDPTVQIVVDGYTTYISVPVTSWTIGAMTDANMQAFAASINAATPAGLGDIAFYNTATKKMYLQSPGKSVGYTYISIPVEQTDVPAGNAAAAIRAMVMLGFGFEDVKVQNQMTVETEAGSQTISFDYSTVHGYGLTPAVLTSTQVATLINSQFGSTIAAIDTGLNLTLTNAYRGIDGFVKSHGYQTTQADIDSTAFDYTAGWYLPSDAPVRFDGAEVATATDFNNVYLKCNFGTDWAIVRISDITYASNVPAIASSALDVEATSFAVTSGQITTFKTALANKLRGQITSAPGRGYVIGGLTNAIPSAGDVLEVHDISGDTGDRVKVVDATDHSGLLPATHEAVVSYTVTVGTGPDATTVKLVNGVNEVSVTSLYDDRDLLLFIDNSGPITFAGKNMTGFASSGSYATWLQKESITVTDDETGNITIGAAGEISTTGAITVSTTNAAHAMVLDIVAKDSLGTSYSVLAAVVPSGTTPFTTPLKMGDGLTATECPVDIVTLAQGGGNDLTWTALGTYAYIDTTTGFLEMDLKAVQLDGTAVPLAAAGGKVTMYLVGNADMAYTFRPSATLPGMYATQWQTGVNATSRVAFNNITSSFVSTSRSFFPNDDWGGGYNRLAVVVDGSYTVDVDFNDYTFVDQSAATANETVDAINARARLVNSSLDGFATAVSNSIVLTSPTKGVTSQLRGVVDNTALDFSAIVSTPATGSGYPYLSFKIDGGTTQTIDFTDYIGTIIANQGAATATEVVNAILRATSLSSSLVYVDGVGVSQTVNLKSLVTGSGGTVEIVIDNQALGDDFGIRTVYFGSQDEVAAGVGFAVSPGTWANSTEDALKLKFTDENPLFFAPNTSRVDIYSGSTLLATYREVSPNPNADGSHGTTGQGTFIETVLGNSNDVANDVNPNPYIAFDLDEDLTTDAIEYSGGKFKAGTYALSGGADGITGLTESDFIGVSYDITYGGPTGLQNFADKDAVFLNFIVAPGRSEIAVIQELFSICEARGDSTAIVDPPISLQPEQVVDWHNGLGYGNTVALNSSYAALYGTWFLHNDPYNKVNIYLPPSSYILKQFAYSDSVSDPWFATAGNTRGKITGAIGIEYSPNQGERDLMYGNGNAVNPIVNFAQDGIKIWGQKTLSRTESSLNRINVRRLFNFLRRTVELASEVILFEPNDAITRAKLVEIIENVISDVVKRRGIVRFAVVDKTDAFLINQNRIKIVVFVEPQQTAEFIEIPFVITGSGQAFIEG